MTLVLLYVAIALLLLCTLLLISAFVTVVNIEKRVENIEQMIERNRLFKRGAPSALFNDVAPKEWHI